MLFHTNTPHLHIRVLCIIVNMVVSQNPAVTSATGENRSSFTVVSIVRASELPVQGSHQQNVGTRETTPPSSGAGDSAFITQSTVPQAVGTRRILEHVASEPPPPWRSPFLVIGRGHSQLLGTKNYYFTTSPHLCK